jgi:tRNA G37 N-methylase TrmD
MRIDILTLFPDMCETVLSESIIGRARKKGYADDKLPRYPRLFARQTQLMSTTRRMAAARA